MAGLSRYDVNAEDTGLEGRVLKNKLGIKEQKKLHDTETVLLADTYSHFFELLKKGAVTFNLALLFQIHKLFLETLYPWAGKIRVINISKKGVLFTPAHYIDDALHAFEKILKKNVPDVRDTKKETAQKFAVIHNEFNAVHPFREGNGRTIRLFLDLLAVHLEYNPINWGGTTRTNYIKACADGMLIKHTTMERIIYRGLTKNKSALTANRQRAY
ncbi:MAG: Fic family protein [Patescibacteria group bacterium]